LLGHNMWITVVPLQSSLSLILSIF